MGGWVWGVCKFCCKLSMSVVMMVGRGRGGAMFQLVPGYGSGLEGGGLDRTRAVVSFPRRITLQWRKFTNFFCILIHCTFPWYACFKKKNGLLFLHSYFYVPTFPRILSFGKIYKNEMLLKRFKRRK